MILAPSCWVWLPRGRERAYHDWHGSAILFPFNGYDFAHSSIRTVGSDVVIALVSFIYIGTCFGIQRAQCVSTHGCNPTALVTATSY